MLRQARFAAGVADQPGERRALPDDWRVTSRGTRVATYELRFPGGRIEPQEWAVYLPSLSMNAAVYLNGHFLGDGGELTDPVSRNWSRPLLFPFPSSLVSRGENSLRVELHADLAGMGLLGLVYVGPHRALARLHARRYRLKVTAVWVITLCLAMIGVFMTALWDGWREEASYGWFAAAVFAWAAIHLNALIVDIPMRTTAWYGLWYIALGWWAVLQTRFLIAFVGEGHPRLERGLTTLALAGSMIVVLLTLLGSPWVHGFVRLWLTLALFVGAYAVSLVVRLLRERGGELDVILSHVLGLSVVGCALHDWLIFVGLGGATYDYYLPYAAPLVLLGMGWALIRRFVGALRQSEALAGDLEERVQGKREELARSYERLREVDRSRVLAEERERILREMHDGLGSHLVSTLALIDGEHSSPEAVGRAIRSAVDDLRLMIDSLEPLEGDLLGALATWRARMQPRLEAAGIGVEWRVDDLPPISDLGPHKVLQVLRILQETVTNVLKHAGARALTVRTGSEERSSGRRRVYVEIIDDGHGIAEPRPPGRGLHHMRQRADEIGAALEIDGSTRGTRVRLLIPVDEASAA